MPFGKYDESVLTYSFITFGPRVEGLINHGLFKERHGDYEELLFHDIVTLFLFLGFIYGHMVPMGMIAVMYHDITDWAFHFARAFRACKFHRVSEVLFVGNQFAWVYFRMYCFPLGCIQLLQTEYTGERAKFQPFIYLVVGFQFMLISLHYLWFAMFQRINYQAFVLKNKKVNNIINLQNNGIPVPEHSSAE